MRIARRILAVVGTALPCGALLFAGCSERVYRYVGADGGVVEVVVRGTDSQFGVIDAGKQASDGSKIWLRVENLSQTDRSLEVVGKAIDKLPVIPAGVP